MTNELSGNPHRTTGANSFPKRSRLLKSSEFRTVYDQGFRVTTPNFAAFCLRSESNDGPKVGFTTPRALGSAVTRNRIRRRMREAVRIRLDRLGPDWRIVFNPRRTALDAPFAQIESDIDKVFRRCVKS